VSGDGPPRPRWVPREVVEKTYAAHKALYDGIQAALPSGEKVLVGATVLLISGCLDEQTSSDGEKNGLFTAVLLKVWHKGKFKGNYQRFYKAIKQQMPMWQVPNYY